MEYLYKMDNIISIELAKTCQANE